MKQISPITYNVINNLYRLNFKLSEDEMKYLSDDRQIITLTLDHQYTPTEIGHTFDVHIVCCVNRNRKCFEFVFTLGDSETTRIVNNSDMFTNETIDDKTRQDFKDFLYENCKMICEKYIPTIKLQKLLSVQD